MSAVGELVDRAVALPPGPELARALDRITWSQVPNARLVEVVQARSRQLAHEQAQLLAGLVEISRATAVDELVVEVERRPAPAAWASGEIAAALTWTPRAAERELAFAEVLLIHLPLVFQALDHGEIDRGKAWVFARLLDPATSELAEPQIARLCAWFVPLAPGLTTRQLAGRLARAIQAVDPLSCRRRYERAVRERGVALHLDPLSGTAVLVGTGLPPDQAAAAAARLDRLAAAARRAGHPATLPQISADLFLGMLDGRFHGLTEQQIVDALRRDGLDGADAGSTVEEQALAAPPGTASDESGTGNPGRPADPTATGPQAPRPGASTAPADVGDAGVPGLREGIEIRVGLATLLGLDERPGEIPGLGPVVADRARAAAAAQHAGAAWRFAVTDSAGYLVLAGRLSRRPALPRTERGRVRGGIVEIHLTVAELRRLADAPAAEGAWAAVIGDVARQWADRGQLLAEQDRHPTDRFARRALARHVQVRDRTCVGVGCTCPASRSHLDHTREHAAGGPTVAANLGPCCPRHHADKDRRWHLTQPAPGMFRWRSPLGREYRTRGEPVRVPLPEPATPRATEPTPTGLDPTPRPVPEPDDQPP